MAPFHPLALGSDQILRLAGGYERVPVHSILECAHRVELGLGLVSGEVSKGEMQEEREECTAGSVVGYPNPNPSRFEKILSGRSDLFFFQIPTFTRPNNAKQSKAKQNCRSGRSTLESVALGSVGPG
jgi:hypothetical protein